MEGKKRACHKYRFIRKKQRESFYDNVIFVTWVVSMNERLANSICQGKKIIVACPRKLFLSIHHSKNSS